MGRSIYQIESYTTWVGRSPLSGSAIDIEPVKILTPKSSQDKESSG
ncbi:MAG: hypothetical protein SWY16_00250 [Cyanobacteriota bacterium]|nr:hypothetical protein [Cyanobacteriota bacterium]